MPRSNLAPGATYFVDVTPEGLEDAECRNSGTKGDKPRPWLIVAYRKKAGIVVMVPLLSKPGTPLLSIPVGPDDFDSEPAASPRLLDNHVSYARVEHVRSLAISRLPTQGSVRDLAGQLGTQKLSQIRTVLAEMFDPCA